MEVVLLTPTYGVLKKTFTTVLGKQKKVQHSSHGQQVLQGILDLRHTQRLHRRSAKSRVCTGQTCRQKDPMNYLASSL